MVTGENHRAGTRYGGERVSTAATERRDERLVIPFSKGCVVGRERENLAEVLASGRLSGDGPFTERCERLLERQLGAPRVLLTTSGTHALELAAMLAGIGEGDEVIVPTFTFVSTANAFVLRGAVPVFVDIRSDTLNLDESALPDAITPRTRAIAPVHYAGVGCEMDRVQAIATVHDLALIEDNAHGIYGRYRGRWLGTLGSWGALSFHGTKNFCCGEGGALIVNERSSVDRAEILREKGTDRRRFRRGEVDKYTWVDIGSSYVMSEVLAAFLLGQLEARDAVMDRRERIYRYYEAHLADWAAERGVRLPVVPPHCDSSYHMFYLLMPSAQTCRGLATHLQRQGITAASHYVPLHHSPMGRRVGRSPLGCPVAEDVSERLIRLPFYHDLTPADQERVVAAVRSF